MSNLMRIRILERWLMGVGLTLLVVWGAVRVQSGLSSRATVKTFQKEQLQAVSSNSPPMIDPSSGSRVDFSSWSAKRANAYKESLVTDTTLPLALLRIPKLNLEVPVYNGTDDLTLNRGVGRILGTAKIGKGGNLGIAGHRDGFFRNLKDLAPDDKIELEQIDKLETYVIDKIQIVDPENVSVLAPTPVPSLTLVTCYPFYYVGNAPQRYIVHAFLINSGQPH
jgi:sortase A